MDPFEGISRGDLALVLAGEGGISGDVVFSVREQLGCVGIPYLEHPDDLPQLVAGRFGVGLREYGAHHGGDHRPGAFRHLGQ